ncbi:protein ANTAGONIST OF LIKE HETEROCHROMATIN PROTEIN 1-like, partial [Aphis craccivora]
MKEWLKKRNTFSHHNLLDELRLSSPSDYRNYLRMDYTTFSELLNMITPMIEKQYTCMREPISPAQRLSSTLRCLATGVNFEELKFISAIAPQTIRKIIIETCEAIITVSKFIFNSLKKCLQFKKNGKLFLITLNQNGILIIVWGAIDGKQIEIIRSQESGSIVLMAIANANYEFIMVDIVSNGRVSDAGNPEPDYLPGISDKFPYVFVADDAFPLSNNLMKPYPHRNLSQEKRIFNYRLLRALRIIENFFGILASRFRILLKTINLCPEKTTIIVRVCCHLHNFLRQRKMETFLNDSVDFENILTGYVEPGSWRNQDEQFGQLQPYQGRNSSVTAKEIRDKFCDYFNNAGAYHYFKLLITYSCVF